MSLAAQLTTNLTTSNFPTPSEAWLRSYLASARAGTPLAALTATAKHRLLALDITTAVLDARNGVFPPNVADAAVKSQTLRGAIPVQVLSVEDLSKSRWEQLEALEAAERGETTRGREVIRVVREEGGEVENVAAGAAAGRGPHKLVLQDMDGRTCFAVELRDVALVDARMNVGTKLMLKGAVVARGMVLLEPATVVVLGGKIEALHAAWVAGRKRELLDAIAQIPRG